MEKYTTRPHILRPQLTIVNSNLYYFRFSSSKIHFSKEIWHFIWNNKDSHPTR